MKFNKEDKKIIDFANYLIYWIVPLMLIIGYTIGALWNIPNHIDIEVGYGDDVEAMFEIINGSRSMPSVNPVWACHDGCYFAEGLRYNQSELIKPSPLYDDCSEQCWNEHGTDNDNGLL